MKEDVLQQLKGNILDMRISPDAAENMVHLEKVIIDIKQLIESAKLTFYTLIQLKRMPD